MRIAIIGSGISGNVAAYLLNTDHDITLYERRNRIGGHSATVDVDYDGTQIAVDTGFIVYNELNYPFLIRLFDALGVATEKSDMSFAVSMNKGQFEWTGHSLDGLFAQRKHLFSPRFWGMVRGILAFNKRALSDLANGHIGEESLGEYLDKIGVNTLTKDAYIIPMGAAIWSTPAKEMLDFPAISFIRFFANHKLLHMQKPMWRTVSGGSRTYVEKLTESFRDKIRLSSEATIVKRFSDCVEVTDKTGATEKYDQVIFACHSDQALKALADASEEEREILSAIRYRPNQVYLHRDESLMPKRKKVWAAWNYLRETDSGSTDVVVSYWMNRLQNLDPSKPLFVTLNPETPPKPELTFGHYEYDHPQYDGPALKAQKRLPDLQGKNRTWFCGAYHTYGFHEDGAMSGARVAVALGAKLPWAGDLEDLHKGDH